MKFGDLLRKERRKAGLNQYETGVKIGVHASRISRIESGEIEPSEEIKRRLSDIFPGLGPGTMNESPKSTMNLDSGSLAEWIRVRREEKGLSRHQLAERAGVSDATILFIESGRTESPQKPTLDALTSVLGPLPDKLDEEVRRENAIEDLEFRGAFPIDGWQEYVEKDKPIPCVYVFYDEQQRPVRIGATDDLKRRFPEYKLHWWFQSPTAVTFAYIVVRDEELRRKIERAMIKLVGKHAMFNILDRI